MAPQPSTSRTSNREPAGGASARLKRLFSRENLPRSRAARITIGIVLTLGGFVGFLPILGFWMVPMGLAVLAIDIPAVRRFTRKTKVLLARFWHRIRH